MRLLERLDGRRVLLTGVTGFVGEALLQRLLTDLPGTVPVVLVRPKSGQPGRDRIAGMLRKPTFAAAVERAGGPEALLAEVEVLEGDLAAVPVLPADLDVVVHCAGDVSFDPAIQDAFATNVDGTHALLTRVLEASAAPERTRVHPIHYVHVSTAYVGGRRRGAVPERSVDHDVDWRVERDAGLRMAGRIEDDSREPELLTRLSREAAREHGRAGPITVAQDGEQRRRDWVKEQQRAAGGERGRSLGWTDAYTFTKAMGERVVEELTSAASPGPALPVSIVRPSIIESALVSPHPGWIEGFKMADPIILAYGRGEFPEFPASPDSVVDIVPVDHVVNALLAVCATDPEPGVPQYFHVSSGARNPLSFRRLYELVREHFEKHPFDLGERGAVALPTWRFPGSQQVERVLAQGETAHRLADRALSLAPRSEKVRELSRDLDRTKTRLDSLRRYLELYRSYTQVELQFVDDRTLGLHRGLDPADLETFGFDTAQVDWTHYIRDIHCPAVTAPIRRYDVVRKRRAAAGEPRTRRLDGDPAGVLAVFDMDGTLMSSNVIETYLWLRLPELTRADRLREIGALLRRVPAYVGAERRDRGGFLRAVYRRYVGADLHELDALVDQVVTPHVLERVSGAALRRVREHRAAGHHTVLLTGAVRPLTRPLAPLFDHVVAAELAVDTEGRATGYLATPPLVGESRAAWLVRYAEVNGFDLSRSYGYADSHSDLPMLRAVGKPTAVSPDVSLYRAARTARWPVELWSTPSMTSRLRVPDVRHDTTGASLT